MIIIENTKASNIRSKLDIFIILIFQYDEINLAIKFINVYI